MKATDDYYLNLMGIDRWQARSTPVACETFTLLAKNTAVGILSLQTLSCSDEEQSRIGDLLDAMLAAIKLQRSAEAHAGFEPRLQLVLGEDLAQQLLKTAKSLEAIRVNNPYQYSQKQMVFTYHPWVLLQHPEYKRKAWEDLKGLSNGLSS